MTAPIERLLPQILRAAPSCPDLTALRELRQAARVLCERLPAWRATLTETVTTPADHVLATLPSGAQLHRIEKARIDTAELEPIALADLDARRPAWDLDEEEGNPRYITQVMAGGVSLYPRVEGELVLRGLLKPSDTATTLPARLMAEYGEIIARGALGAVLALPGTDFANPGLAAGHLGYFNQKTNVGAQARVRSGQQGARIRTKTRFF